MIESRVRGVTIRAVKLSGTALLSIIFLLLLKGATIRSQTLPRAEAPAMTHPRIDSLERLLLHSSDTDTTRVLVFADLAIEYAGTFPEKSREYANRALQLAQNLHFSHGESQALLAIGLYYWFQNLYDASFQYMAKAAAGFERLGREQDVARAYTHIGNVHLRTARYDKARDYYNKSLAIAERLRDTERIAFNISSRAQTFRRIEKDYERALQDLDEGRKLFRQVGNMPRVAINTNIMGSVHDDMKQPQKALEYHLQALALERTLPATPHLLETLVDVVTSLNAQKRYAESLPYLQEAERVASTINTRHIKMYLYDTMAETYEALGQFESAYRAKSYAFLLKDTVFASDRAVAIEETEARFALTEKDHLLEKKAAEIQYQRLLRNVFIAGMLLFIGISLWILFLYRAKHRTEKELLEKQDFIEGQSATIQEANTQLQEQNTILQRLNDEKNEFLGIAVHDLKNPLSAIYLTADLIKQTLSLGKIDKINEYTNAIRVASNQMLAIIGNLLDINKLEQGAWQLVLEPIDVHIVELVVESYLLRAEEKNITLRYTSALEPFEQIFADQTACQHIFDNLISNAIKYSSRCGLVDVCVRRIGERIQVRVQDSGQGLTEQDKLLLFKKFARLSARPTNGETSTGLGLSIVKKLADAMMNVHVWCESEYGKGATFIVEFPAAK